jgi:hypothetical protein
MGCNQNERAAQAVLDPLNVLVERPNDFQDAAHITFLPVVPARRKSVPPTNPRPPRLHAGKQPG